MEKVYIGLGSNIGDSLLTLKQALLAIAKIPNTYLIKCSRFYNTTPVSDIVQNDYINAACLIETTLSPLEVLHELNHIEKKLGRMRKEKNAPRTLDLDILFFGEKIVDMPNLKIPHPRLQERLFVLKPLSDIMDEIFIIDPKDSSLIQKIDINNYLNHFPNIHHETVELI